MAPYALVAFSLVLAAFAVWVLRARSRSPINRWFAAYMLAMGGWTLGLGILHAGLTPEITSRFVFASASFIPGCFLAFTRVYPTHSHWPPRFVVRIVLIAGIVFSLLSLTTPLLIYDAELTPTGFVRKSGLLYPAFVLYFLATWLTALSLFIAKWRSSRGHARAQLQYFGIGLVVSFVGGISTNLLTPFLTGTSSHTWLGPFFILPLVILVGHAIIRHRLMDLRLVIHQGLAYVAATAFVSVVTVLAARLFVPAWGTETLSVRPDIMTVGIVILVMLSIPVQRLLGRFVDPYLFRGRTDYTIALQAATRRLSLLMPPAELAIELRRILSEAFVPESFVMVVQPFDGAQLEELSADNSAALDLLKSTSTIVSLLTTQPSPFVFIVNPAREMEGRRAHTALRNAGVELVMTLGRRGQLLGSVLLGPRRSGDAYFVADLNFIESLNELASIALENALLYRQRIQLLEYSDRLLESLESAVVAVDVAGKITSFNPAAMTLFGLTEKNRGAFLDALPSEIGWALSLVTHGSWRPRDVEVTIDHISKGLRQVVVSTAVLHDDQQQVAGALAVVTDLSAVKALERNQRRVEHLAMMARFYTGIAHEIRSPLGSIANFISMLPDRFDDSEYRDTAARLLPIEVDRIVRLADRLRLMAPSEGGKLGPIALPPLLNDIVAIHSPAASDRGVRINLHCPDELSTILGDRGQLVQLVVNLLNNAIEAMADGGTVTIEAAQIHRTSGTNAIVVRVIDEGIGIDPVVRSKMFEPFFTTKPSGTGLGLSICREIADFHRAHLSILPRMTSRGTIVQIEFPCALPELMDQRLKATLGSN